MTEKIDGLPESVIYGGFRVEYAGTTTFHDRAGNLWFRHEYAYCDLPHVVDRVYFFRVEGDDEPITDVTGFEVVFESPRQSRRKYKWVNGQHVATVESVDTETTRKNMREVLAYLDARRKQRDERRQEDESRKVSRDLSKRIREQGGGE